MKLSHFLSYIFSVSFLCISFLFHGCIEEIKIEALTGPTSGRLVVEGLITNQRKAHQVKLTRVNTALPDNPSAVVSGAEVSITDGEVTWILYEQTESSGIYLTDSLVSGKVGKTYTLTIRIADEVYSASDHMEPVHE